jgi:hypothetical protein
LRLLGKLIKKNEKPMSHNYTDEELLHYLYNEEDELNHLAFNEKIQQDIFLKEEYHLHIETLSLLDQLFIKPNPTNIDLLMEYSASFKQEESLL